MDHESAEIEIEDGDGVQPTWGALTRSAMDRGDGAEVWRLLAGASAAGQAGSDLAALVVYWLRGFDAAGGSREPGLR